MLALLPLSAMASDVPTLMRVAMVTPPDVQIYPLQVMDRDMLSMLDLVYESLVVINDQREPEPGLATFEKRTADGRSWAFTLREGVLFHDGRKLLASDVGATIDAIKAIAAQEIPDNEKGMYVNVANMVTSWKAEDDRTIVIQTSRPYYGFLYAMTFPILQAQSIAQPNPPGTGPYRIEYYAPGEQLWLAGNQNWYGPSPHVSEVIGIIYDNVEQALTDFEAEDIDIVMTRSSAAARYRGTASSRINSYDYSTRQLEVLLMNNRSRIFRTNAAKVNEESGEKLSEGLREAIIYAINKTRLSGGVYQNLVTTTDVIQSPAAVNLYNDSVGNYTYNPEKAGKILDALGWDNYNDKGVRIKRSENGETSELEIRLNYYNEPGNNLRKEAANEIVAMLKEVGISVKLAGQSFETAQSKLKQSVSDFDMYLCAYNFDVVPDPSFLLLSDGYGNYSIYRSHKDVMNSLCKELRASSEVEEFRLVWQQIQAQVFKDAPFLPLYWRNGIILTRYPYSSVQDIREFELLKSLNAYK